MRILSVGGARVDRLGIEPRYRSCPEPPGANGRILAALLLAGPTPGTRGLVRNAAAPARTLRRL